MRFYLNNQTYQFTAPPFGIATALLEFTKVVMEVKLMAKTRGTRIHHYLDDWMLRALCHGICQQHTQTLLALCHNLGWVVNVKKSELILQQDFTIVGYQFDRLGDTHSEEMGGLAAKTPVHQEQGHLHSQAIYVSGRSVDDNRKTDLIRSTSYEAYPVASEATLAIA